MALYIFSNTLYSEPFSFNFGARRNYLVFFDCCKIRISVFYFREHIELVYILQKKSRKWHCIIFMTDYIQSNFALNIGVPR